MLSLVGLLQVSTILYHPSTAAALSAEIHTSSLKHSGRAGAADNQLRIWQPQPCRFWADGLVRRSEMRWLDPVRDSDRGETYPLIEEIEASNEWPRKWTADACLWLVAWRKSANDTDNAAQRTRHAFTPPPSPSPSPSMLFHSSKSGQIRGRNAPNRGRRGVCGADRPEDGRTVGVGGALPLRRLTQQDLRLGATGILGNSEANLAVGIGFGQEQSSPAEFAHLEIQVPPVRFPFQSIEIVDTVHQSRDAKMGVGGSLSGVECFVSI